MALQELLAPGGGNAPAMSLDEVQELQRWFDERHWTAPSGSPAEKRRHIVFHMAILLGKLARIEERADHDRSDTTLFDEAVADLVVFAAQLADIGGARLQDLYLQRLRAVARGRYTAAG